MHELYLLKDVAEGALIPASFVLEAEDKQPDDFGGYMVIYSRGSHRVRFLWNGRDGCGYLEHSRLSGKWQRIGTEIPEGSPQLMRTAAAAEWPGVIAEAVE